MADMTYEALYAAIKSCYEEKSGGKTYEEWLRDDLRGWESIGLSSFVREFH